MFLHRPVGWKWCDARNGNHEILSLVISMSTCSLFFKPVFQMFLYFRVVLVWRVPTWMGQCGVWLWTKAGTGWKRINEIQNGPIWQPAAQQTAVQLPLCVGTTFNGASCRLLRPCGVYFRCIVSVSRQVSPDRQANQTVSVCAVSFVVPWGPNARDRCLVLPFLCLHLPLLSLDKPLEYN